MARSTPPQTHRRDGRLACSFCGYAIPGEPVRTRGEGSLAFCSETCAESFSNGDEPLAGRDSFERFVPGVPVLDTLLPWGMPADSFVLLSGEEGMRHRGLQTELVWRALERGEPCIIVSFVDAPVAIVGEFLSFGWNVLPSLESGRLHIVDCFTNRLREEHRIPETQTNRNSFFERFLDESVTVVKDSTNLVEVESKLHDAAKSLEMVGTGAIVIDSINEMSIQGQELQTEQFVKEIRTDICNRLSVPIFASTTITEEGDFSKNHAYIFDGIVDMQHNEQVLPGVRLKQISVRKLDGIRYRPDWVAYENVGHGGFVAFDPYTEFNLVYPFQNQQ